MAVIESEMKWFYSGDGTPNGSLGGGITENEIPNGDMQNVFDHVKPDEAEQVDTEYRCIYLKNTNTDDIAYDVKLYIIDTTSPDDLIEIGLDPAGKNGVAQQIPNEKVAPTGVVFAAPASPDEAIEVGDLGPGEYIAVWVRRVVSPNAMYTKENVGYIICRWATG